MTILLFCQFLDYGSLVLLPTCVRVFFFFSRRGRIFSIDLGDRYWTIYYCCILLFFFLELIELKLFLAEQKRAKILLKGCSIIVYLMVKTKKKNSIKILKITAFPKTWLNEISSDSYHLNVLFYFCFFYTTFCNFAIYFTTKTVAFSRV